jgi:hypothetical protein
VGIQFSDAVMQAMGFRSFGASEAITAAFYSITAFELRGVRLPDEPAIESTGVIAGTPYKIALSGSPNRACLAIAGDTYGDEDSQWKKETKSEGPYALVLIGPTKQFTCDAGRVSHLQEGVATTYDCFPEAGKELAKLELKVMGPLVSALTVAFNDPNRHVAVRKVHRSSHGKTPLGGTVLDTRMTMSAEIYTAYNIASDQAFEKLNSAVALARNVNPKSAHLFSLGLAESDQLKRFLYLFLTLEVETHATFKRMDHGKGVAAILGSGGAVTPTTVKLLEAQMSSLRGLNDRFAWCAAHEWPAISESDVEQFQLLKGARDDIAHGTAAEPPLGYAAKAELLAQKILRS